MDKAELKQNIRKVKKFLKERDYSWLKKIKFS